MYTCLLSMIVPRNLRCMPWNFLEKPSYKEGQHQSGHLTKALTAQMAPAEAATALLFCTVGVLLHALPLAATLPRHMPRGHALYSGCRSTWPDACPGSWRDDYAVLHAQIIGGHRAPRYLTIDGRTGLADRMVAAVSGLALAILTDRAFVMTHHLGGDKVSLGEVYCSPYIQWQHQPSGLRNLSNINCLWDHWKMPFRKPCTFWKGDTSLTLNFTKVFGDVELVQITAQNGLLSWLFDRPEHRNYLHSLGLTVANAYGCLSNYLFEANTELRSVLPPDVLEVLEVNTVIGLQIRAGDGILESQSRNVIDWETITAPWINCARDLEASLGVQRHPVRWLLVTDSRQLKTWAEEKFRDKIIIGTHDVISHSTKGDGLRGAAVDNWLLGLTDFKVISDLSHFGRSAALRSHGNTSIFTVGQDRELHDRAYRGEAVFAEGIARSCSVDHPDQPFQILRSWVGA